MPEAVVLLSQQKSNASLCIFLATVFTTIAALGMDARAFGLENIEASQRLSSLDSDVNRSIQTIANIRAFGALGDGRTDDTAAVQEALATGLTVYIPAGIYMTRGNILTRAGQRLIGDGRSSVLKLMPNTYTSVLTANNLDNIHIAKLSIDGNASKNPLDSGAYTFRGILKSSPETAGIRIVNGRSVVVEECEIRDAHSSAIVLESCTDSSIKRCTSINHLREGIGIIGGLRCVIALCESTYDGRGFSKSPPWSLYFTAGKQGEKSEHNHGVLNNIALNSQAAFITVNTLNTVVSGNTVGKTLSTELGNGPGIRLGHLDDAAIIHLRAWGCIVSDNLIFGISTTHPKATNSRGISCDNAMDSEINNNEIINCTDGIAVSVTSGQRLSICRNRIKDTANRGITLFNVDGGICQENTIDKCLDGVFIQGNNASIFNNRISKFRRTGIAAINSGKYNLTGLVIKGNQIMEGATGSQDFLLRSTAR